MGGNSYLYRRSSEIWRCTKVKNFNFHFLMSITGETSKIEVVEELPPDDRTQR